MSTAVVHVNGSRAALPTLLGDGQPRIPTGGKVRAGIKVLTRKAAEHAKAREAYDCGVAAGHSFERIEKAISEAVPELKAPLVPKNVPWFSVRGDDFANRQTAQQILDLFGEDRGDGVRRLYRFPVVFPSDQWQAVMPHELVTWGANERKYWSEYSGDGRTRWCKCYAPVPMDDSGKRAIRLFGGRKTVTRADNGGVCEPERCREYQLRQCNLSGRFVFFIPGIKSIDAFELATHSFYAMNAAIRRFETMAFMRGGRISGFLDGHRTPFWFSKKLIEVPRIDEQGKAVRVAQWIIELEAPVDVTALLRPHDDDGAVAAEADSARGVLEGGPQPHELPFGEVDGASVSDEPCAHGAPATTDAAPAEGASQPPSVQVVLKAAQALGIDPKRFAAYASKRLGEDWKNSAHDRGRALAGIQRYAATPQTLIASIDATLGSGDGAAR